MSTWAAPRYGRASLWFDKGTLRLWFFDQRHEARTSYPCVEHFYTEPKTYFEQAPDDIISSFQTDSRKILRKDCSLLLNGAKRSDGRLLTFPIFGIFFCRKYKTCLIETRFTNELDQVHLACRTH